MIPFFKKVISYLIILSFLSMDIAKCMDQPEHDGARTPAAKPTARIQTPPPHQVTLLKNIHPPLLGLQAMVQIVTHLL